MAKLLLRAQKLKQIGILAVNCLTLVHLRGKLTDLLVVICYFILILQMNNDRKCDLLFCHSKKVQNGQSV